MFFLSFINIPAAICSTTSASTASLAKLDWINDIGSLLAWVEIKSHSRINSLDVATVKELCYMRDNL